MKITVSQLRRIIKEEVQKATKSQSRLRENAENAIAQYGFESLKGLTQDEIDTMNAIMYYDALDLRDSFNVDDVSALVKKLRRKYTMRVVGADMYKQLQDQLLPKMFDYIDAYSDEYA